MKDLINIRRKQYSKIFAAAAAVFVLFFGIFNVGDQTKSISGISSAAEDCISVFCDDICEIAACECPGATLLRHLVSGNGNTGKASFSKTGLDCLLSVFTLSLVGLFCYILYLCIWNIFSARLFIISYIHNQDGMKP